MKSSKRIIGMICTLVLCLTSINPVYAADPYLNYGAKTGTINVQNYSSKYGKKWTERIDKCITAWNNSGANVNISISTNSKNIIESAEYSDTWYGSTNQVYNKKTGYTSQFTIRINRRTIKQAAEKYGMFARSTLVHEIGHVFWLCDNPSTNKASIMKYNRNRNTMVKPQTVDVDNVNKKYK